MPPPRPGAPPPPGGTWVLREAGDTAHAAIVRVQLVLGTRKLRTDAITEVNPRHAGRQAVVVTADDEILARRVGAPALRASGPVRYRRQRLPRPGGIGALVPSRGAMRCAAWTRGRMRGANGQANRPRGVWPGACYQRRPKLVVRRRVPKLAASARQHHELSCAERAEQHNLERPVERCQIASGASPKCAHRTGVAAPARHKASATGRESESLPSSAATCSRRTLFAGRVHPTIPFRIGTVNSAVHDQPPISASG